MEFIPEIVSAVRTLGPMHMAFILNMSVLVVVQTALLVVYKTN